VYSKNHMDQINRMCGQHAEFLVLSLAVGIPTTSLQKKLFICCCSKAETNHRLVAIAKMLLYGLHSEKHHHKTYVFIEDLSLHYFGTIN
jgi:hypothetical protein